MLSRLRRKVVWLARLIKVMASTQWWWVRRGGVMPWGWLVALVIAALQRSIWDVVILFIIGTNLALYMSLWEGYEAVVAQNKQMRAALAKHREYFDRLSANSLLETFRRGPR
jgi:hypothetical protein